MEVEGGQRQTEKEGKRERRRIKVEKETVRGEWFRD
jgi:hypothetical protein